MRTHAHTLLDNRISSLLPLLSEGKYRLVLLFVGLVLTFLACGHNGMHIPHTKLKLKKGGELEEKLRNMPLLRSKDPALPPKVARFPEATAKPLVKEMLSSIAYLHANGIVHRDLKLENFIFSGPGKGEGAIKLIDFGYVNVNKKKPGKYRRLVETQKVSSRGALFT